VTHNHRTRREFGDFQTPPALAQEVCHLLRRLHLEPASIVEPTCGLGSFFLAALDAFPRTRHALALDINRDYIAALRRSLRRASVYTTTDLLCQDFFRTDWASRLSALPEPLLVIGNPPWVTNAELGVLGSHNLPAKTNFQGHRGLDAITGKSNFDISEWMLIHLLECLGSRKAVLAMLCKTAVARKVLIHAWKQGHQVTDASLYSFDALKNFGAAVDACLLVCRTGTGTRRQECDIHDTFHAEVSASLGVQEGMLVADPRLYRRWKHLRAARPTKWRSGIKHDCARVMELKQSPNGLENGFGEQVSVEPECLFPMLKGSEVASGQTDEPRRRMVVTQRQVGDSTLSLQSVAPRTWAYLLDHSHLLDRRASSIYKGRPRFSIFAVGDYTFAPWKIAISGLYKRLAFSVVGPSGGRPMVFDDTVYFLPFQNRIQAECVFELLQSSPAQEFYRAFMFWDSKRPITSEVLGRLDLRAVARELNEPQERRLLLEDALEFPPEVTPQKAPGLFATS
jgi:hypothetical protein